MGFFSDIHAFPDEAFSSAARIVIRDHREVLIEQHRGLYAYDTCRIQIRSSKGLIVVEGKEMTIAYFGVQDMLIRGTISAVRLEETP